MLSSITNVAGAQAQPTMDEAHEEEEL